MGSGAARLEISARQDVVGGAPVVGRRVRSIRGVQDFGPIGIYRHLAVDHEGPAETADCAARGDVCGRHDGADVQHGH